MTTTSRNGDSDSPPAGMMRRRLLFILPVLAFVGLAAVSLWGLQPGRDPSLVPSAMIDKPAPEFALPAVAGLDRPGLTRADLQGAEVSLVNIFASWCLPCRAEHPLLVDLVEREGVTLHGINYKDKPDAATAWLAELGNPYTRVGADAGRAAIEWGVYGVPETFVIDSKGHIRYHHRGPLFQDVIEADIVPLIDRLRAEAAR